MQRAGFGESPDKVFSLLGQPTEAVVNELFDRSHSCTMINILPSDYRRYYRKDMNEEEKKAAQMLKGEYNKRLIIAWLNKLFTTDEVLREKMTFFWHGHFACRDDDPPSAQSLNNTIRKFALGNFGDLLRAVSKEPAMLRFLNNQQNRKASPNENFAREVMELFTLGRGNYSETDIKESARAFTGWTFDDEGVFQFRRNIHDDGLKQVFGKTGRFAGDDILDLILARKECARFITTKLYTFFVNDTPDYGIIDRLAKQFYESGYDIAAVMKTMFTANWFYDAKQRGALIKSPIDLIVGTSRMLRLEIHNAYPLINIQRVLGQLLYNPPNVAGWKGGKSWIDSSTLLFRMNFGERMLTSRPVQSVAKQDDDMLEKLDMAELEKIKNLVVAADWSKFAGSFRDAKKIASVEEIARFLLRVKNTDAENEILKTISLNTDLETTLRDTVIKIISLPEYQMC